MVDIDKYWNPKFEVIGRLIEILYDLPECSCGGCCHIVTDDNNIRDSDLEFVIEYCDQNKDRIDSEISRLIALLLLDFTIEQRVILFTFIEDDIYDDYSKETFESYFENICDPETIIKNTKYNIG